MGRSVLITGAGARVGAHLAQGLAADGWHICIHYLRSETRAQALADQITAAGGTASTVKANLSVPQEINSLIERCERPLDALINNASTFAPDTAQNFTTATWDYHRAVNLDAPLRLSADFAAQAKAGSSIINMIDQRVLKPNPQFFTYSLAKAGLYWATKTMAQSFAPHVRVNGIGPGPTLENTEQAAGEFSAEAKATLLGEGSPPDTILHSVRYLLSAEAVTGQMIAVDGGQHLVWQTPDLAFGGAL
ncbi:short chain dehydrogenase [Litorimonas cladophorae]|uniref:Short chain dehydrogenase n=1 Tax=Litorimonas cladophorae TaxID=1220491 RepID=A0A918NEE0_9PROT|nr:SDR family oxidoreductase [Litorimonas cladophorae]GGX61112.1 short chain dehydrogenase [Litorimonas cladophorae]